MRESEGVRACDSTGVGCYDVLCIRLSCHNRKVAYVLDEFAMSELSAMK